MDYLTAAKGAMNFIDTRKKKGPEGIYWSLEDAVKGRPIYYDEICMYAGRPESFASFWDFMMQRKRTNIWRRQRRPLIILSGAGKMSRN